MLLNNAARIMRWTASLARSFQPLRRLDLSHVSTYNLLTMNGVLFSASFVLAMASSLWADANVHITDVGLDGHAESIAAVRIVLRNPAAQGQLIHLQVAAKGQNQITNVVTTDVPVSAGEERVLELPVETSGLLDSITATATVAGTTFGHDTFRQSQRGSNNLIVLMCGHEDICKTMQSQIQFSGSIEDRVDKNRNTSFDTVNNPRDHWWVYSYSECNSIVVAMPLGKLASTQRDALEGFLRRGGRLVLVESEIDDPSFLAAYRKNAPSPKGERVGKGTLFRVLELHGDALGDVFAGANLQGALHPENGIWFNRDLMVDRFAAAFKSPSLNWILFWLAVYIVTIGALNFAVLRWLRRLEYGWVSMCALAFVFAAGFYFFSAKGRPKTFTLDNLATYVLDAKSSIAAADYSLRIAASERRDITVSVTDSAVFTSPGFLNQTEGNSQIWVEMNGGHDQMRQENGIRIGPTSQMDLLLLKWSFRDLSLQGLHEFPGTVHFVAPNRLRNDTGQQLGEAIYLDRSANALYQLPAMAQGDEVQLDTITPTPIYEKDETPQRGMARESEPSKQTLQALARQGRLQLFTGGRLFAAFSDGPALPVDVNISHQSNLHSLIIVNLGQP